MIWGNSDTLTPVQRLRLNICLRCRCPEVANLCRETPGECDWLADLAAANCAYVQHLERRGRAREIDSLVTALLADVRQSKGLPPAPRAATAPRSVLVPRPTARQLLARTAGSTLVLLLVAFVVVFALLYAAAMGVRP